MLPRGAALRLLQLVLLASHSGVLSFADWIVHPPTTPSTARSSAGGCELELSNGLLSRRFSVPGPGCHNPNFATIDLADVTAADMPPKSALAALDVEASVELDGRRWDVGGWNQTCQRWLRSNPHTTHESVFSTCAYLNRSQPSYAAPAANVSAFQYVAHSTGPTVAPFEYKAARHASDTPWPPVGIHLAVNFSAPSNAPLRVKGVTVTVHYELYQGIPALSKWVTVSAQASSPAARATVGNVIVEQLRGGPRHARAAKLWILSTCLSSLYIIFLLEPG
jgi:hypothetical protein